MQHVLLLFSLGLLVVYWPVALQIRSDLGTRPRRRVALNEAYASLPAARVASPVSLQQTISENAIGVSGPRAGALALPAAVPRPRSESLGLRETPAGRLLRPRHRRVMVTPAACLFDRVHNASVLRVSQNSQLTHGMARVALGPAGSTPAADEIVWVSENVCNNLYQAMLPGTARRPTLAPYARHLRPDPLGCATRLGRQNRTWAGFACQVSRDALWDFCPELGEAQRHLCAQTPKRPPPPTCCDRVFGEGGYFSATLDGAPLGMYVLANETVEPFLHVGNLTGDANATDLGVSFSLADNDKPRSTAMEFYLRVNNVALGFDAAAVPGRELVFIGSGTPFKAVFGEATASPGSCSAPVGFAGRTGQLAMTCVAGASLSVAQYVCIHIGGGWLRPSFSPRPCADDTAHLFHLQRGTGRLLHQSRPVCSGDLGLYVGTGPDTTCAGARDVYLYASEADELADPDDVVAVATATVGATGPPVFSSWVVRPATRTVVLAAQNGQTQFRGTRLSRPGYMADDALFPAHGGFLMWAQTVPEDEFLGFSVDDITIAEVDLKTEVAFRAVSPAPGFYRFAPLLTQTEHIIGRPRCAEKMEVCPAGTLSPAESRALEVVVPTLARAPMIAGHTLRLSVGGLCADETARNYTSLFFSQKECLLSQLHFHWLSYTQDLSSICAVGFSAEDVGGVFRCVARRVGVGAFPRTRRVPWVQKSVDHRRAPTVVGPYLSVVFSDAHINASAASLPATFMSVGCDRQVSVALSHLSATPPACMTMPYGDAWALANLTRAFPISTESYRARACEAYRALSIENVGWIGTLDEAQSLCGELPARSETILGGSRHVVHVWQRAGAPGLTEAAQCLELVCPRKPLNATMSYHYDVSVTHIVRPVWALRDWAQWEQVCGDHPSANCLSLDFSADILAYMRRAAQVFGTMNTFQVPMKPVSMEMRAARTIRDPSTNAVLYAEGQLLHRVDMTDAFSVLMLCNNEDPCFQRGGIQSYLFWHPDSRVYMSELEVIMAQPRTNRELQEAYAAMGGFNTFRGASLKPNIVTPLLTDFLFRSQACAATEPCAMKWYDFTPSLCRQTVIDASVAAKDPDKVLEAGARFAGTEATIYEISSFAGAIGGPVVDAIVAAGLAIYNLLQFIDDLIPAWDPERKSKELVSLVHERCNQSMLFYEASHEGEVGGIDFLAPVNQRGKYVNIYMQYEWA